MPPSLAFDRRIATRFCTALRSLTIAPVVFEPRHASWFESPVDRLLKKFHVSRAMADPPPVPEAERPGGSRDIAYYRLHGSPRMYYSSYTRDYLQSLASRLLAETEECRTVCCIFDNTARGAAMPNARTLAQLLWPCGSDQGRE